MDDETLTTVMERYELSARDWERLRPMFSPRTLAKDEHLVSAGDVFRSFALVTRGLLRNYYSSADGRETTKLFCGPGGLIGPYAEILRNTEARTNLQAMEPSEVLVAPYEPFARLCKTDLVLANLLRRVAELTYLDKDEREYELLNLNAEERYLKLCAAHPDWLERIPQYHLASYLGITPVALSRIRSRLRERG